MTKALAVGHPPSGALQFSVHDSFLLDVYDYERLIHYRTPTEPSSGSDTRTKNKFRHVFVAAAERTQYC
jgi:hypothetical protein